ncbi:hypothetical protein [Burkholderia cepacia]|nr:hypothetical protein [Burkholderia cepacia]
MKVLSKKARSRAMRLFAFAATVYGIARCAARHLLLHSCYARP